jgi:hypothetical protein
MAVEIWDVHGKNIEDTGMPGELVCTRPHPSMPVFFWGDHNNEKYRKAYFDTYPGMYFVALEIVKLFTHNARYQGVWRQGDFIVKNPKTRGFMILGRRYGPYSVVRGESEELTITLATVCSIPAECGSARPRYMPFLINSAMNLTTHYVWDSVGQRTMTSASCFFARCVLVSSLLMHSFSV